MKSEFETWPATPVEASLKSAEVLSTLDPAEVASFLTKRSSRGRPTIQQILPIGDCRLPIEQNQWFLIGNWKLKIGNEFL